MRRRVLLAESAKRDVEDIYRYIAMHDSIVNADRVFGALDGACHQLTELHCR